MVYNFRIAQITRQPTAEEKTKATSCSIVALIFDQCRKNRNP